jgi:hypothetical protein
MVKKRPYSLEPIKTALENAVQLVNSALPLRNVLRGVLAFRETTFFFKDLTRLLGFQCRQRDFPELYFRNLYFSVEKSFVSKGEQNITT